MDRCGEGQLLRVAKHVSVRPGRTAAAAQIARIAALKACMPAVEAARRDLLALNVFAQVSVQIGKQEDESGAFRSRSRSSSGCGMP